MKRAVVEAFLPELKGGNINQVCRASGSTWPLAVYRALKEIQKQIRPKMKKGAKRVGGRSVHSMRLTVSIFDVEEGSGQNGQSKQ